MLNILGILGERFTRATYFLRREAIGSVYETGEAAQIRGSS
jgi:hypothetical protein